MKNKNELILRHLTLDDEQAFLHAYNSWDRSPSFLFAQSYEPTMKFSDYIDLLNNFSIGKKLPQGFVPATSLNAFVDGKIVGRVGIRHELNDFLLKFGGHVGYGVLPEYRRKGYAKLMLQGALEYCKKLGIKKVLVTCDDDNIGSIKTIESANGLLENKIEFAADKPLRRRYWIHL